MYALNVIKYDLCVLTLNVLALLLSALCYELQDSDRCDSFNILHSIQLIVVLPCSMRGTWQCQTLRRLLLNPVEGPPPRVSLQVLEWC